MRSYLLFALACMILCAQFSWAAEDSDDGTYEDSEAIFESIHKVRAPETGGESIEDILSRLFEEAEAEVDEGTYPASELWERDLDLRRTKPPELGYSGRIYGKFSKDDVSGVEKWERDLELTWNYDDWDGFFRYSDYNPFSNKQEPSRLEKAQVRYHNGDGRYTLGSLGAVFGRGLALNMFEDRPVDFDNEVEGAKIEYTLGKTELTALYGTRKDRGQRHNSEIQAARVAVPVGNDALIGAHFVQTKFPDLAFNPTNPLLLEYDVYGGDLTLRKGPITLFAETARLNRSLEPTATELWDQDGRTGKAYYANLSFSWPGISIAGEYKDYQGMYQPFSVLPPLRRYYEQAKAEPNDDKGYMFSATWAPSKKNDAYFLGTYGQGSSHTEVLPYTEMNFAYSSRTDRKQSYVPEFWRVVINGTIREIWRLSSSRRLSEDWTASGTYEHERFNPLYSKGYVDFIYQGELSYQSKFNMSFTQEETGNDMAGARSYWKLWEFKIKPDERQEINIIKGSRREGYVCSGGVCRPEPPFEGLRVDYVFRF